MVETPQAVLDGAGDRGRLERLAVLVMGTNDLAKELAPGTCRGVRRCSPSLSRCCRRPAAGIAILDGVFNDVSDLDGFEAECRQGATWASTARR